MSVCVVLWWCALFPAQQCANAWSLLDVQGTSVASRVGVCLGVHNVVSTMHLVNKMCWSVAGCCRRHLPRERLHSVWLADNNSSIPISDDTRRCLPPRRHFNFWIFLSDLVLGGVTGSHVRSEPYTLEDCSSRLVGLSLSLLILSPRRRFREVWFYVGDVELEGGNIRMLPTTALLFHGV